MPATDFALSPIRHRRPRDAPLVVGVALVLALIFGLLSCGLGEPDRIDRLTLVNTSDYGINVSVRSSADAGRFDLGWVWEHAERDVRDAPDIGATWIFRFSYAGIDAGEQTVSRAELAAVGWRFEISPVVAERLAAAGVGPAFHDQGFALAR